MKMELEQKNIVKDWVSEEIRRLQTFSEWKNVLKPSGRSVDDIINIITPLVQAHLDQWWDIRYRCILHGWHKLYSKNDQNQKISE